MRCCPLGVVIGEIGLLVLLLTSKMLLYANIGGRASIFTSSSQVLTTARCYHKKSKERLEKDYHGTIMEEYQWN